MRGRSPRRVHGRIGPTNERCNGLDDDCDGSPDEGLRRACGSDVGECSAGTEICVAGAFETCAGSVGPATEDCDGLDNDRDGSTDESAAADAAWLAC
ncbi:MAG: hypothetical protein OHK0013_30770 [Sandaracinaceae bacterium]